MKKYIKQIVLIIGILILIIYALPLAAGILNAGNIFGIGVGAILISLAKYGKRIIDLANTKARKQILAILCAIAIAGTSVFAITLGSIVHTAYEKPSNNPSTLIILGCKVNGEQPSLQLYKRAIRGCEYMLDNPNAVAIVCGGKGTNEGISEAECIKKVLVDNGVDEDRIYLEDQSTSTDENILFAKNIIKQNKLDTNVIISTSDYHCYRAKMIAKKNGLTANTLPSYADKFSKPTFYTREVFGVWAQYIK